jgi:hypothetical protein
VDVLVRLAAPSAFLAVPVVFLAGVTLAIFFLGPGEPFGSLNDLFDAIALLLLIPPVLGIQARLGDAPVGWLGPLSLLTILGLLVAAIGELLLIARVIDLGTSYITGGIGILPLLVWICALIWLSLGAHLLPEWLGWSGAAFLASAVVVIVFASLRFELATGITSVVLLVALLCWLVTLGVALRGGGEALSLT